MDTATALPGVAVTVKAVDDFYQYIDGWTGIIADRPGSAGSVWIDCLNPDNLPVSFLVPPDQLELRT